MHAWWSVAASVNWVPFCKCPYNVSPTIWGAVYHIGMITGDGIVYGPSFMVHVVRKSRLNVLGPRQAA